MQYLMKLSMRLPDASHRA